MDRKTFLLLILILFSTKTYSFEITPKQILGGTLGISIVLLGNYSIRKIEKAFNVEVPIGIISFPSLFLIKYIFNMVPPFKNKNKLDKDIYKAEQFYKIKKANNEALVKELYLSKFTKPVLNIIRKIQLKTEEEIEEDLDTINQIDKEIRTEFYKKIKPRNLIPSFRFLYFKTPSLFDISRHFTVSSGTKRKIKEDFLPEYNKQMHKFRNSLCQTALDKAQKKQNNEPNLEEFKKSIF